MVDGNVDAKGTRKVAQAYLEYLYSKEGQALVAKNYYRPSDPSAVDPADLKRFPNIPLVTIDDPIFGGGRRCRRPSSPTAACSTSSTSRPNKARPEAAALSPRRPPGYRYETRTLNAARSDGAGGADGSQRT